MSERKDEVIKKSYYDRAGFGSVLKTYNSAKARDNTITLDNVKNWFYSNVENKRKPTGYNSYITDEPYFEYQVDLAFFKSDPCLVMIDIFTKYAVAMPLPSRDKADVIAGMMEGFTKMGKKPKMIYTDGEGALRSNLFEEFCNEQKIKLIITRTHAYVAERFIRTLKNAISKRLDNDKTGKTWKDFLFEIILTYNNKDIHSGHGMTPKEARLDKNRMQVKANLELHRVSNRKYPDIKVDDKVKVFRKKLITTQKENTSYWLPTIYTVNKITESFNQKYYHLEGYIRPLLRHEILKVS